VAVKKKESASRVVAQRDAGEIAPEMQVVILAAAAAFLGANFKMRSIKLLQTSRGATDRWSKQGRTLVHASHNPRSKR
jgi:hypothetical protein